MIFISTLKFRVSSFWADFWELVHTILQLATYMINMDIYGYIRNKIFCMDPDLHNAYIRNMVVFE